jgi:hypothetical protein
LRAFETDVLARAFPPFGGDGIWRPIKHAHGSVGVAPVGRGLGYRAIGASGLQWGAFDYSWAVKRGVEVDSLDELSPGRVVRETNDVLLFGVVVLAAYLVAFFAVAHVVISSYVDGYGFQAAAPLATPAAELPSS